MYIPPAFREDDPATLRGIIDDTRLATLVTATPEGLVATPLPLFFDAGEGGHGVLYGSARTAPRRIASVSRQGLLTARARTNGPFWAMIPTGSR